MERSGIAVRCSDLLGTILNRPKNSLVAGFNERTGIIFVRFVFLHAIRDWRSAEIIKWRGYFHRRKTFRDEILQQEKLNVALKIAKEIEEPGVARQDVSERTFIVHVVPPNALQGQIEPVTYSACAAPSLVYSPFSVDSVSWEDHHTAHRVTSGVE